MVALEDVIVLRVIPALQLNQIERLKPRFKDAQWVTFSLLYCVLSALLVARVVCVRWHMQILMIAGFYSVNQDPPGPQVNSK